MKMSEELKTSWSPEVIRVMFNHGYYEFVDIVGEVEPPFKKSSSAKETYGVWFVNNSWLKLGYSLYVMGVNPF